MEFGLLDIKANDSNHIKEADSDFTSGKAGDVDNRNENLLKARTLKILAKIKISDLAKPKKLKAKKSDFTKANSFETDFLLLNPKNLC